MNKDGGDERTERLFFNYAFPCSQTLMQLKRISEYQFNKLKDCFEKGTVPDREEMEIVFVAAFVRIRRLAKLRGKDYWDHDIIKEYWESYHNENIDNGDGFYENAPESFRDLCRTTVAEIVGIRESENKKMLIVEYSDKKGLRKRRILFNNLVPDVKTGDKVRMHYGYAVEKV